MVSTVKKAKAGSEDREWQSEVWDQVVKEDLMQEVTFEKSPKWTEERSTASIWGKSVQAKKSKEDSKVRG